MLWWLLISVGRGQLKCNGTRAETRFRLSTKLTSPFKWVGASIQSTEVCESAFIVGSNVGYIMLRGSVKGNGYPLHSSVSPSLPLPCFTVCHHISTGVYSIRNLILSPLGHLEFCCAWHIFEKFLHPVLVPQVPVLMHRRRGEVIHNLYLNNFVKQPSERITVVHLFKKSPIN